MNGRELFLKQFPDTKHIPLAELIAYNERTTRYTFTTKGFIRDIDCDAELATFLWKCEHARQVDAKEGNILPPPPKILLGEGPYEA